jgi:hypothetical protein
MSRKTYVIRDGQLVEKQYASCSQPNAPTVMGDIQPYQSMVTGEMVTSRSRHRAILKEHNCIEVGNETKYLKSKPLAPPPGLKEQVIQAVKKHRGY